MTQSLTVFLDLSNETLASAIVIVAVSMLLYNLTRNFKDRVARTSSAVLGCVTIVYIGDVLTSLEPGLGTYEALLRFQWLGLAFIPAATFHLSDALLETTGLPSRGRRRRVVRLLYSISAFFLVLAAFTDSIINPQQFGARISMGAGILFPIYVVYFLLNNSVAFINVERARRRCLTRGTQRRMAYLQFAMLTPVIGIFPYSVVLGAGQEYTLNALFLVNLANLVVILMLLFLAYPLSFFGSRLPDRVVKADLLRFMLRGPGTGLVALVIIVYTDPIGEPWGLPGNTFLPFATVAVILLWQWIIDLAIPLLEKRLIYPDEDDDQMVKFQKLSERYLSRDDLIQLIEAILEASCDYLRVNTAFVASVIDINTSEYEVIKTTGQMTQLDLWPDLNKLLQPDEISHLMQPNLHQWQSFWVIPLYSQRSAAAQDDPLIGIIGIMGIEARSSEIDLTSDEVQTLNTFVYRAAQALDDMLLQTEIYAALEGLLPQISLTRSRTAEVEFRPGRTPSLKGNRLSDRLQIIEQVHAALRHYWGGPGLSQSRLLELGIVQDMLPQTNGNAVKALREVLTQAIEKLRPAGERDMKSQEWMLYNIIQLRFIEKRKARETAQRLYMAEASLYRKQNVAIETVADAIIMMEKED